MTIRWAIRSMWAFWVTVVLIIFALGVHAHAQPGGLTYKPGQPPQVTQLPEGRMGDALFLIVTQGSNPPGYYACGSASCTPTTNWVCMTCGGGGFTAGGDLTGTSSNQTVRGIQTIQVDPTAPTNNFFMVYSSGVGKWISRVIGASDVPPLDASKITTGTFSSTQIPTSLLAALYTFSGEVRADFFTSTSAGESFLQLSDQSLCTLSPGGKLKICSQSGQLYLSMLGAALNAFQMQSQKNAVSGYAGLNSSGFVAFAQLGTGSTGAGSKCLTDNFSWQTCAAGGVTWPLLAAVDGGAGTPAYSFASDTLSGLYRNGPNDIRITVNSTPIHKYTSSTYGLVTDVGCFDQGTGADIHWCRDSATQSGDRFGTLGTGGGQHWVYGTRTDASNYEALALGWDGTRFIIGAVKLGTGNARAIGIFVNGQNRWFYGTNGNVTPATDNAYDIGGNGTNHVHGVWAGTTINNQGAYTDEIPNDTVTGTTVNQLNSIFTANKVKVTGALNGTIGPTVAGAGITGSATVCTHGVCVCTFTAGTTAGDWVIQGTNPNTNKCTDAGYSTGFPAPVNHHVLGVALTTNGAGGDYQYVTLVGLPRSSEALSFSPTFCTTSTTQFNTCTDTVSLQTADQFPDTNYTIVCQVATVSTGTPILIRSVPASSSTFTVVTMNMLSGSASRIASIGCVVGHD